MNPTISPAGQLDAESRAIAADEAQHNLAGRAFADHQSLLCARVLFLMGIAVLLLGSGCVSSINPPFTEADIVTDDAIEGIWVEQKNSSAPSPEEGWVVERASGKAYIATHVSATETNRFEAHLFRIGGQLFLDLFPKDKDARALFVPSHMFVKITKLGPLLEVASLDYDLLSQYLTDHPKALAHRPIHREEEFLLTASTKELRKFLRARLKTEKAWAEPTIYIRSLDNPNGTGQ